MQGAVDACLLAYLALALSTVTELQCRTSSIQTMHLSGALCHSFVTKSFCPHEATSTGIVAIKKAACNCTLQYTEGWCCEGNSYQLHPLVACCVYQGIERIHSVGIFAIRYCCSCLLLKQVQVLGTQLCNMLCYKQALPAHATFSAVWSMAVG